MVLNEEEDLTLVLLLTKEETKEFLECIRIKYSEKFEGNSNCYNLIIQKSRLWGRLLAQKEDYHRPQSSLQTRLSFKIPNKWPTI